MLKVEVVFSKSGKRNYLILYGTPPVCDVLPIETNNGNDLSFISSVRNVMTLDLA